MTAHGELREQGRPTLRFVSPERRWRAAFMVLPAAFFGWRFYTYVGPLAGYLVAAGLLGLGLPILRSCLIATDEGLIDRRAVRTVRLEWWQIRSFSVDRPGGPWGGFCVIAECLDGTQVDLLSTRVYTRAPSPSHLDELHRLSWTLEERLVPPRPVDPAR